MADPASDPDSDAPEEVSPPAEVPFASRIVGLVVLIAVFGVLYLLAVAMPKAGDVVTEGVQKLIPTGDGAESATPTAASSPIAEPTAEVETAVVRLEGTADDDAYLKRQVAAAFPNPDEVEVIAVLFSEQKDEFLAMYKVGSDGVQEEIILTRDKFGRYLSAPDSPVRMMVLAPKE